jgi:heme/copper-type cytochrome/quinol oxidase subunit 3
MNTTYEQHRVPRPLPVGKAGFRTSGWWGMLALIGTEASLFAYLLFSYFYLQSHSSQPWPPTGLPPLRYAVPTTVVLLISAATMWWAEYSIRLARPARLLSGMAITLLLGIVYVILQFLDWRDEPFLLNADAYSSLFYVITAFHVLHAVVGLLIIIAALLWSALGHIDAQRRIAIAVVAMYWYFVVAVWVAVFITLYLLPYISPHQGG